MNMSNEMVTKQRRRTVGGDFRPGEAAATGVIAGKRAGDRGGEREVGRFTGWRLDPLNLAYWSITGRVSIIN
jgi:hypothetical protein